MDQDKYLQDFLWRLKELEKLIKSWKLIAGASSQEFDPLANKILNSLTNDEDFDKIKRILRSDLTTVYGLYAHEIDVEQYLDQIKDWWFNIG